MRSKWLPLIVLFAGAALVQAAPARAAEAADPNQQSLEQYLAAARGDLIQRRNSALHTLVTLEEGQVKTFGALRDQYDAELKKIGEARQALLTEYTKNHKSLTPEQAKDLAARSLKLDDERNGLRRKYFELMSQQVSVLAAGQFLQIQRQFETMMDLKVQTIVPLAGE